MNGNELAYFDKIQYQNHQFTNFQNILIESDTSWIACVYPSITNKEKGFDLVHLSKNKDVKLLGTLSWKEQLAIRSSVYSKQLDKLVLGAVLCENNCTDRWIKYLVFDLSKLKNSMVKTDNLANELFHIYPNPVQNYLFFESTLLPDHVIVYNSEGKVILRQVLQSNVVNITELTSGFHIAVFKNKEEVIKRVKFFKEN